MTPISLAKYARWNRFIKGLTTSLNKVKESCITMSEENNAPETVAEPTETSEAVETQTGNEATEAQELTIPSNWEQPVREFFKSDVFKGNAQAQKTFFDKFKSLDDGYQAKFRDLSKREKDFASQREAFKEQERFLNAYRDFENTIAEADRSKILSDYGGMPQYMARLYNLDKQFSNDPLGFINGLMRNSGITLEMLQNGVNSPAYQQRQFQNQQAAQLGKMEQRLEELVSQRLSQDAFQRDVLAFKNERDSEGNIAHPHLEQVADVMDLLMGQNPTLTLQQAYDNACYAVPEVRDMMLKEKLEQDTKAQIAKQELEKAKKAKGITQTPTPAGTIKKKDWRTVLEEGIEAQGGE